MRGFAQLMMHKTEIVGASDQIHARLKRSETTSGMTGFARQAGQPFPKGAVQALDKSRVEGHPPSRAQEQLLCLLQETMGHSAHDLHHALFLASFDHRANVQLRPDLQARSSNSRRPLDLLTERSADAARICAPAVCYHQQRSQASSTPANLGQQAVGQAAITPAGPRLLSTSASKPSWPIPSRRSSGILSPEFHRLERASGPVARVQ